MITVKDVLSIMESGAMCSITYVTMDATRNSGGQVIHFPEAQLLQKENEPEQHAVESATASDKKVKKKRKDPHHRKHYTRNIRVFQEGDPTSIIRKIHPPLITRFNNQIVTT